MSAHNPISNTYDTARMSEPKPAGAERLGVVGMCVILAGGLRASALAHAAGRSVLDLHLTKSRTVLGTWVDAFDEAGISAPVCIAHGGDVPAPILEAGVSDRVRLSADEQDYRGPAGALRDAWASFGRAGDVLAVEGGRWAGTSLRGFVEDHQNSGADVTVAVNADMTPAGMYLIRAHALECIERVGYVDMKEQWLARARADGHDVRGYVLAGVGTRSLRTLALMLDASRVAQGAAGAFRVICPGACVENDLDVVDSIIMPGAVVEGGAVVARSIVLPGGHVPSGRVIVDGVVPGDGREATTPAGLAREVYAAGRDGSLDDDGQMDTGHICAAACGGPSGMTDRLAA